MTWKSAKSILSAMVLVVGLLVWSDHAAAETDEMPLLTGELWQQLSPDSKLAFVWGIVHVIEFERNLTKDVWGPDPKSFVPHFVTGLKGKTLNDVVIGVDQYYLASPNRLTDPVMKAIVHAVIIPAL